MKSAAIEIKECYEWIENIKSSTELSESMKQFIIRHEMRYVKYLEFKMGA